MTRYLRRQDLGIASSLLTVTLYFATAMLVVPALVWSHDPSAPAKFERRRVRIPIENFTLVDQAARPFSFASLRGKLAVVSFTYTTCPDVCPLITAAMRQVQESLIPEERILTYFITITTDPEIDTPPVMAAYAKRYGVDVTNWVFLTGDEAALKKVWKNFGVGVRRKARGLVDHTALTAIVDRGGTMRIAYNGATPEVKAFQQDLREFLRGR